MENKYFDDFFQLLESNTGIAMDGSKAYLFSSRLDPVARLHGFSDFVALIQHLVTRPLERLHWEAFEAMATNETSFFRDKYPFDAIKDVLLPQIMMRKKASHQINIWCAAASTGQEPYSLAILLHENFPELSGWNVNLYATDMSERALEQARAGLYSETEVKRGLSAEQIQRYFTRTESGSFQIIDALRSAVRFSNVNLVRPWPVLPKADLILLRNVLIYLNKEKKLQVVNKMREQLAEPDGCMMLGSSESLLSDLSFKLHRLDRVSYYSMA